jgi:hypothetical protein
MAVELICTGLYWYICVLLQYYGNSSWNPVHLDMHHIKLFHDMVYWGTYLVLPCL